MDSNRCRISGASAGHRRGRIGYLGRPAAILVRGREGRCACGLGHGRCLRPQPKASPRDRQPTSQGTRSIAFPWRRPYDETLMDLSRAAELRLPPSLGVPWCPLGPLLAPVAFLAVGNWRPTLANEATEPTVGERRTRGHLSSWPSTALGRANTSFFDPVDTGSRAAGQQAGPGSG